MFQHGDHFHDTVELLYEAWAMEYGTCVMGYGSWGTGHGIWGMVWGLRHGIWGMVWSLRHGIWGMIWGLCHGIWGLRYESVMLLCGIFSLFLCVALFMRVEDVFDRIVAIS